MSDVQLRGCLYPYWLLSELVYKMLHRMSRRQINCKLCCYIILYSWQLYGWKETIFLAFKKLHERLSYWESGLGTKWRSRFLCRYTDIWIVLVIRETNWQVYLNPPNSQSSTPAHSVCHPALLLIKNHKCVHRYCWISLDTGYRSYVLRMFVRHRLMISEHRVQLNYRLNSLSRAEVPCFA